MSQIIDILRSQTKVGDNFKIWFEKAYPDFLYENFISLSYWFQIGVMIEYLNSHQLLLVVDLEVEHTIEVFRENCEFLQVKLVENNGS